MRRGGSGHRFPTCCPHWRKPPLAPEEGRFGVLDRLRQSSPAVAWKLLISLLPSMLAISLETYKPRWREWAPEELPPFDPIGRVRQINPVVERLLADVGVEGMRWGDLIGILDDVPADYCEAILSKLDDLDPYALDRRGR